MQLSDMFLAGLADSKSAASHSANKKPAHHALDFQSALVNQQSQIRSEEKAAARRQHKADNENREPVQAQQSTTKKVDEPVRERTDFVKTDSPSRRVVEENNTEPSIAKDPSTVDSGRRADRSDKSTESTGPTKRLTGEQLPAETDSSADGSLESLPEGVEFAPLAPELALAATDHMEVALQPLVPTQDSISPSLHAFSGQRGSAIGFANTSPAAAPVGLAIASLGTEQASAVTSVTMSPTTTLGDLTTTAVVANPLDASFKLGVVDAQTSTLVTAKTSLLAGVAGTTVEPRTISLSNASAPAVSQALTGAVAGMDAAVNAKGAGAVESQARISLDVQFGRSEWNNQVANKVAQMAAKNLNFAEIQLDPPELGPLQVRVSVNQEQAAVTFTAAAAQVRDALESGHSRLKEMLEKEGLDLVDVDVRGETEQEQNSELESEQDGSELSDAGTIENSAEPLTSTIELGVDAFV